MDFTITDTNIVGEILFNIPSGTTKLFCYYNKNLKTLPKLPDELEKLTLEGCENLGTIDIPKGLKELNLNGCAGLKNLPELSEGLELLNLGLCKGLETITNIPESVRELNIYACKKLKVLPKLSDELERLDAQNCESLEIITNIPEKAKGVFLSFNKIRTLPELPNDLKKFSVIACNSLRTLPELPDDLEEFTVSGCDNLETILDIPQGVKKLKISRCKNLRTLPEFPDGLEELEIGDCDNLELLPKIPPGVKILKIGSGSFVNQLQPQKPSLFNLLNSLLYSRTLVEIPEGVEQLDASFNRNLVTLPQLPDGVEILNLLDCTNLETVTNVPKEAKRLVLKNCKNLKDLPELPDGLTRLKLNGCDSLISTPELRKKLLELDNQGCDISYPEGFNLYQDAVEREEKLQKIVDIYEKNNPTKIIRTRELLHSILTEGVKDRGGISAVLVGVDPVLDVLEKNPQHLEWVDEISKSLIDGCVNQPVAIWSEISSLAAMAQKTKVADKLDASTQLRAVNELTKFMASLPEEQKPGAGVEVEAGNLTLREVHQRLLKNGDIKEPWPGVPNKVRYESFVNESKWKERANVIDQAYELIKGSCINQTLSEKANYLCKGYLLESWRAIAFPKTVAVIKEEYSEKLDDLDLNSPEYEEKSSALRTEREEKLTSTIEKLTDAVVKRNSPPIATSSTSSEKLSKSKDELQIT